MPASRSTAQHRWPPALSGAVVCWFVFAAVSVAVAWRYGDGERFAPPIPPRPPVENCNFPVPGPKFFASLFWAARVGTAILAVVVACVISILAGFVLYSGTPALPDARGCSWIATFLLIPAHGLVLILCGPAEEAKVSPELFAYVAGHLGPLIFASILSLRIPVYPPVLAPTHER